MNRNSRFHFFTALAFLTLLITTVFASDYQPKPNDPYYAKFNPRLAPKPGPLLLKTGDRLAIVGDSITEQKRYSRILETYLTVCVPQLKVTVRQFGWGGETAEGFRKRMDQDCLRFKPTIATFNYGMNDSRYRPYDDVNGEWYASNYTAIVRAFKAAGARVILSSPGCVGKLAPWANTPFVTMDEHNLNLCTLRDIDIRIAADEDVRFADVFWPMLKASHEGELRYGNANRPFQLCGPDGVHPNWSGHLVMARAFLLAMGLDGDIGTFTVDLAANHAYATDGHKIDSFKNGELAITSTRYPFCDSGKTNDANSIRAGMSLVPFNRELNRLMLVVKNIGAPRCEIIWGSSTNTYTAEQLAAGINLANDFAVNPFSEPFKRVDDAVAAKQKYETVQIKQIFHGPEGKANIEAAVARTEKERAPLAKAIADALVPVHHTIQIVPVQ
jgi:lysophospholipase L1-like esterase